MASRLVFNRGTQVAIDLAVLSVALMAALLLRFDGTVPAEMVKRAVVLWPVVLVLQYGALLAFAVPRFAWRYVGLREAQRIGLAIGASTALLGSMRLMAGALEPGSAVAKLAVLPYGVILIDAVLAYLGIAGVRVIRRLLAERTETRQLRRPRLRARRTILIGAGQAGFLVAKEVGARPDLGIEAVGFLDDDPLKAGTLVHGLPVLGRIADLGRIKDQQEVEQALITIANAPGQVIRRIASECETAGLAPKIIPGLYEIVGGEVNLTRIRKVSIEDLLGRAPVQLDEDAIAEVVRDEVVMVTGAGGSIGAELCRQVARFGPARLVLVERAENSLFLIERELRERAPELVIEPRMADVSDVPRMERLFDQVRPAVVLHAAAHKHVPMMERNPGEAIKNNVCGTRVLADLAREHGVSVFVLVSTDKAVNPSSVMGASKRIAELYVQSLAARSRKTRFVTVRFGNVLGSNGSVVPIFQEQIARGGPVTVTHPEMTRYFMTIPEACQLILQAASMGHGGEIFVLDMGQPVRIVDLARDLIRLSGFVPDRDVPIVFSGVRPGEKLHEELSRADEHADRTRHPKIFVGRGEPRGWSELAAAIERLETVADMSAEDVRSELSRVLPDYKRGGPTSDSHQSPTAQPAPVA
ncbi:MAG: polysaccharide biosynthesis protein [Planctomycetes bacterium]|nr:polysaccharide biosynthesis protein [Planctomycetota bacterium]